jgi:hypothetical protein
LFTEFRVRLDQVRSAFRLRGRVMTSGVGFTMTDGHTGYFWTWSRAEEVLAAFRARGVTIDPQPRGARALWRGTADVHNRGDGTRSAQSARLAGSGRSGGGNGHNDRLRDQPGPAFGSAVVPNIRIP